VVGEFDETGSNRVIKKVTSGPVIPGDFLPERFQIDGFPHVKVGPIQLQVFAGLERQRDGLAAGFAPAGHKACVRPLPYADLKQDGKDF
jgi:hypothetical protein